MFCQLVPCVDRHVERRPVILSVAKNLARRAQRFFATLRMTGSHRLFCLKHNLRSSLHEPLACCTSLLIDHLADHFMCKRKLTATQGSFFGLCFTYDSAA